MQRKRRSIGFFLVVGPVVSLKFPPRRGRLDLSAPWDLDEFMRGPIQDAVNSVAGALAKIVKECLGKPTDQVLLAKTIKSSVSQSVLKVDKKPIKVEFASDGRRLVPMALGNLVNGSWQTSGLFDPKTSSFVHRETIWWPRTAGLAPNDWLVCNPGQQRVAQPGFPSICEDCDAGFYSSGTRSCSPCPPGVLCLAARFLAVMRAPRFICRVYGPESRVHRLHQL